jgi:hypothetical protein
VTEGRGIYLSVQRSFPRRARWRTDMRPVNLVQRPAIPSFTRETFLPVGSSAGGERATDLAALAPWVSSPNCHQHVGAGRHVLRVAVGGAMQRR